MAQYRQSGFDRLGPRSQDLPHHNNLSDHVSIGIRGSSSHGKSGRTRRSIRSDKSRRISIGAVILVLALALCITVLAYYYLSRDSRDLNNYQQPDDDIKSDLDFLTNVTRTETNKVLKFGHGSIVHGRDSRYWDTDDRRRDEDYNENVLEHTNLGTRSESMGKDHVPVKLNDRDKPPLHDALKGSERKGVGLYNEAGRNELKIYEAEYEASLKNAVKSGKATGNKNKLSDDEEFEMQNGAVDMDDEYDDGIDSHDAHMEEYDEPMNEKEYHSVVQGQNRDSRKSSESLDDGTKHRNIAEEVENTSTNVYKENSSLNSQNFENDTTNSHSIQKSQSDSKRKSKRRKFSGCQVKFLNSTAQLVEPLESRKFARFSLRYIGTEEKLNGEYNWEPRFAGHQSLQEREESFLAQDQKIKCGFVNGPKGSPSTGFDLAEDDTNYLSRCHIAVISCIFGNSDHLRAPVSKKVTRLSKKNVCFVMFMDEATLHTLTSEGHAPDIMGFIGLWKIVVVKNLPYTDMRRVGKIPKLLPHRLFPSARYSIWLDSKLRLQLDPLLILEYFLWRKGYEYAISNHYDRHCVWEEVAQNKKLNKYNHTVIDQQFMFYQADGLKRFDASDPNKLLPSNVPEGSFIVRAHTPMSNLFSCLWFNEVERFTPRDQLSFAYTHQKFSRMNPGRPFHLHMFKDCERRAIAKLFRHRSQQQATE